MHIAVGPTENDDEDPREQQEPAQGHDERRDLEPGGQRPLQGADYPAADERSEYRGPPRPVRPRLLDQLEGDHPAHHRHRANRQVDLTEEQHQCLSHRQDHVDGAQPEDIDEVARPQECVLRSDDLEDYGDEHHGQDHRQDAAVASADLDPPGPQVLTQRMSEQLGWDVGRSGRVGGGEVDRCPSVRRPGRDLAGVRGHVVRPSQPPDGSGRLDGRPLEAPVVMYSTTLCRSKSAAGPSATIRPRYSTAIRSATSKTSLRL